MKIVIFGTEKCKFCKVQKNMLSHFNENDWLYVDIEKDKKNLKIAMESNIDGLPTTIIFDDNWNPIYKHEGTVSAEKIYNEFKKDNSIPVGDNLKSLIESGKSTCVIFSEKRKVNPGEKIIISDYRGNKVCEAQVIHSEILNNDEIKKNVHQDIYNEYISLGGNKKESQFIIFGT